MLTSKEIKMALDNISADYDRGYCIAVARSKGYSGEETHQIVAAHMARKLRGQVSVNADVMLLFAPEETIQPIPFEVPDEAIVSVTGHRPPKLGGYSDEAFRKLVSIARDYFVAYPPKLIISGMALGWDQAVARAAIELNIPWEAAVPFKGQEKAWPWQSQQRYNAMLSKATSIVVVSDGGYAAWKMQKRNEYMVDKSSYILAMWDLSSGGTANCIRYARERGKPYINLYNRYKELI